LERITKPVFWTKRALKDLKKVRSFYIDIYGLEKTKIYIQQIYEATKILENPAYDFVQIGAVDEYFTHLKQEYRKIYEHYCKITYREGKDKIYINRVFDMRENPKKNK
jgi:plasmid stabilization system protein ParE